MFDDQPAATDTRPPRNEVLVQPKLGNRATGSCVLIASWGRRTGHTRFGSQRRWLWPWKNHTANKSNPLPTLSAQGRR